MKRSEINRIIAYTIESAEKFKIPLPPFAFYSPEKWGQIDGDEAELVDNSNFAVVKRECNPFCVNSMD